MLALSLSSRHWGSFGGQVQGDETVEAALARGLEEDLGITDVASSRLRDRITAGSGGTDRVAVFVVRDWDGEPTNLATAEYETMRWFGLSELGYLSMDDLTRSEVTALLSPVVTLPEDLE